jgi:hypothetical protein
MLRSGGAVVVASAIVGATSPAAGADTPYAFTCPTVRPTPIVHASGTVPAELLGMLGMLRLAQEPDDLLPPEAVAHEARIVFDDTARLLATGPSGVRYSIVAGKPRATTFQRSCVRRSPPEARRAMRAFVHAQRLEARRTELFLVEDGAQGGEAFGGFDAARIRSGMALGSYPDRPGVFPLNGLVPDGVAGVSVSLKRGPPINAAATNNFFMLDLPVHGSTPPPLKSLTWLGPDGAVLKRLAFLTVFGRVSSASR